MVSSGSAFVSWCQEHLSGNTTEPSEIDIDLVAPEDQLFDANMFADTWKKELAVRRWRCARVQENPNSIPPPNPEFRLCLSLDVGLGGQSDILNGEIFRTLVEQTGYLAATEISGLAASPREITLKYGTPMPLPGIVICSATATKAAGDTISVEASLESGAGEVYCEAKIKYQAVKAQTP